MVILPWSSTVISAEVYAPAVIPVAGNSILTARAVEVSIVNVLEPKLTVLPEDTENGVVPSVISNPANPEGIVAQVPSPFKYLTLSAAAGAGTAPLVPAVVPFAPVKSLILIAGEVPPLETIGAVPVTPVTVPVLAVKGKSDTKP